LANKIFLRSWYISKIFYYSDEVGEENPPALRDFLKTVGSNFILKDRKLLFSYVSPFDVVAKNDQNKEWRCIAAETRTYFKSLSPLGRG